MWQCLQGLTRSCAASCGIRRVAPVALAVIMAVGIVVSASAGPADEARALYSRFVAAQNARDLETVRSLFLASPDFLWVSDGMSVWGPDATIDRMSLFQTAEIWTVEPNLAQSVAVAVDDRSAFLHLPLVLTIGPRRSPVRLAFLVTMLCRETPQGWRIAGLFTTTEKAN